jgi:hypothetical protein
VFGPLTGYWNFRKQALGVKLWNGIVGAPVKAEISPNFSRSSLSIQPGKTLSGAERQKILNSI